jgi:hypothetical protein
MPVLTPTKNTGAASVALPALYVDPAGRIADDVLEQLFEGTSLNSVFVADFLSAVLTHERCGVHLYRSVEGRTNNPVLKAKYAEFGRQTLQHVEILEELVLAAGGNPSYVSPHARAVEGTNSNILQSTFLLAGSVDVVAQEMAMLDAVFLAESIDHANWEALKQLTGAMPEGDFRERFAAAVAAVEEQEDEHLGWAKQTRMRLTLLQARGGLLASASDKGQELVARVQAWLSE